jgi:hypothetical protein
MKVFLFALCPFVFSAQVFAATCCNTPTVWTFKNFDSSPVVLTCTLEKSSSWKGEKIEMTTKPIPAKGSIKHVWDAGWYADGMGMIAGEWRCSLPASDGKLKPSTLVFSTDWGENVTISWNKSRGSVARK